jgi:CRISPR/Cas system-associated protein Cas5 (RAMP superfamily)
MEHSNNFAYKENINAIYGNYNRQLKGFMVQAGLRVENTNAEGHSQGKSWMGANYKPFDSTLDRNYTDVFPSAAVTFNKNPMSQLNFTYSRRIDRPAYQDLNPFEFRLDKYAFQRGNTELRPQYTNSFAVTHTYKYKLNTTVNYSHVTDVFSQLVDVDPLDSSKSYLTKKNLATQDITSLNISYPFSYKSFSSFLNVNSYYSHYQADNGPNRKVDVDVFATSLYMQNSFKFAKVWTVELSGWWSSPSLWQGTFKSKAMGGIDGGIQKVIFKGKGNLKASVGDIFHTMQWSSTSNYAGQLVRVSGQWESRQLRLNLSYRFGSNEIKAARQRKTGIDEENQRANAANSGIGQ